MELEAPRDGEPDAPREGEPGSEGDWVLRQGPRPKARPRVARRPPPLVDAEIRWESLALTGPDRLGRGLGLNDRLKCFHELPRPVGDVRDFQQLLLRLRRQRQSEREHVAEVSERQLALEQAFQLVADLPVAEPGTHAIRRG